MGARAATPVCSSAPVTTVGTPARNVDIVWRRFAYPSADIWRHLHAVTVNSGLVATSSAPTYHTHGERLAVMKGRMRAAPFPGHHDDDMNFPPFYKLYMDFAGPTGVKSIIHEFRHYCGVVDFCTGLGMVYACRAQTADVAISSLKQYLIAARVLLKSSEPITPTIVRTDQGTAFMARDFTDYIASLSAMHSPAVTYAPQQNSLIERLWGTVFNMARVLLASANLPATFHSFAVKHAAFLRNILPTAAKGESRFAACHWYSG